MQDLQQAVREVYTTLAQQSQDCVQRRRPLVRKPPSRAADVKQYNPQFEEEYVAGKDYDPDRYHSAQYLRLYVCFAAYTQFSMPIV